MIRRALHIIGAIIIGAAIAVSAIACGFVALLAHMEGVSL